MKKLINNKKGFTLIELLAVIVILAILVMVAIPAVTKYLNAARQGTFADNAQAAISAVRNDVIKKGKSNSTYTFKEINDLLEKKLIKSPFGEDYDTNSYIKVTQTCDDNNDCTYKYYMCLADKTGHGFGETEEKDIVESAVSMSKATCTSQNP